MTAVLLLFLLADGKPLVSKYGCEACHQIPSVGTALGRVGPTFKGIGTRPYLAGRIQNTRANMVRWIRNPKEFEPRTMMPNLDVSEKDARAIADYLYTLR